VLEVPTTRVDRSMGDVHPRGNPHFSLDPGLAPTITQTIVDGLSRLAPENRAAYEQNRKAFLSRLDQRMADWNKTMAAFKGTKVITYHNDMIYFVTRFGLVQAATVEDRPGIPPSPQHLANLIRQIKEERIKAILVGPWNDVKLASRVAEEAGARVVPIAPSVGAVKGADDYIGAIDHNVNAVAKALQ
jgi:ABC-type Zn uptake system ZnuABC Zn-binding protein ZnuA